MALASDARASGQLPTRTTGQFGVIVFLASDVMLFAAFFAAYYLLRATNDPWPSALAELDTPRALAATLVLVASSFTMIVADRAHERGDRRGQRAWVIVTMLLGLVFLVNQAAEYVTIELRADSDVYGSVYYGLTGLHTLHVATGLAALGVLLIRVVRSKALDEVGSWTGGISLFWHLVDVIWVFVFLTIWVVR